MIVQQIDIYPNLFLSVSRLTGAIGGPGAGWPPRPGPRTNPRARPDEPTGQTTRIGGPGSRSGCCAIQADLRQEPV